MPSHKLRNLIVLLVRSFDLLRSGARGDGFRARFLSSKTTLANVCVALSFCISNYCNFGFSLAWDVSLIRVSSESGLVFEMFPATTKLWSIRLSGRCDVRFNYEATEHAGHLEPHSRPRNFRLVNLMTSARSMLMNFARLCASKCYDE
jgi:hypothetical protein